MRSRARSRTQVTRPAPGRVCPICFKFREVRQADECPAAVCVGPDSGGRRAAPCAMWTLSRPSQRGANEACLRPVAAHAAARRTSSGIRTARVGMARFPAFEDRRASGTDHASTSDVDL